MCPIGVYSVETIIVDGLAVAVVDTTPTNIGVMLYTLDTFGTCIILGAHISIGSTDADESL